MVQAVVEREGPRSKRAGILAAAIDSFGQTSNIARVKFWVLTDSTG